MIHAVHQISILMFDYLDRAIISAFSEHIEDTFLSEAFVQFFAYDRIPVGVQHLIDVWFHLERLRDGFGNALATEFVVQRPISFVI